MSTRLDRDKIETFMRITGASEEVALQKLEEFGGNVDAALNTYYGDVERPTVNQIATGYPQYNSIEMTNQTQPRPRGIFSLLETARSFRPSLLLNPSYRRDLYSQIGASIFPSMETSRHSGGYGQPYYSGPGPVGGEVSGHPVRYNSPNHGAVARDQVVHPDDNDVDEQMVQLAIEASKQEIQPNQEDEDLARAMSLSLQKAEQERAIQKQIQDSNSSFLEESGVLRELPSLGVISAKEVDEAILLEEALFGKSMEGTSSQMESVRHSSLATARGPGMQSTPRPPSPSLTALRQLREKQDEEYLASLLADREKEASKEAANMQSKQRKSNDQIVKQEEAKRFLDSEQPSLPTEPAENDENAVTLLVRMPDGSRCRRRFLKSDKLQILFDFIGANRDMRPGTYHLVKPYPRESYSVIDGTLSLSKLGLTNKQEALYLELI